MRLDLFANKKARRFVVKFAPRWLRSPLYKVLYRAFSSEYLLTAADYVGKSILIVGPARTALLEISDLDVDRFDIVVKMNNGIFLAIDGFTDKDRCDILFHSLTSDTRPVSLAHVAKCGVRTIVHRLPRRRIFLKTLMEEERYEGVSEVKIIPHEDYHALSDKLSGYSPSTGLTCANFFLKVQAAEVAIIGFTFFTTSYVAGYDDGLETDEASLSRVEMAGHHSPKHEARLMHSIIEDAQKRGTYVAVGSAMREAMDAVVSAINAHGTV